MAPFNFDPAIFRRDTAPEDDEQTPWYLRSGANNEAATPTPARSSTVTARAGGVTPRASTGAPSQGLSNLSRLSGQPTAPSPTTPTPGVNPGRPGWLITTTPDDDPTPYQPAPSSPFTRTPSAPWAPTTPQPSWQPSTTARFAPGAAAPAPGQAFDPNVALFEARPATPQAAPAPDWMAPADTWLGQSQRKIVRPGQDTNLFASGAGLLETIGTGLGALAQGVEGTIGTLTANLPRVSFEQGLEVKPSLTQQIKDEVYGIKKNLEGYESPYLRSLRADKLNAPLNAATIDDAELATYAVRNIAYSGVLEERGRENAQVGAAKRIAAGEDPTVAMRGMDRPDPKADAGMQQLWSTKLQEHMDASARLAKAEAMKAYDADPTVGRNADGSRMTREEYAAQREAQKREEAARIVNATGRIPGTENPIAEMAGQMLLDPLNIPGVELAKIFKVGGKAEGLKAGTKAIEVFDGSDQALAALEKMTLGRSQQMGALEKFVADRAGSNPVFKALDGAIRKGQAAIEYTPATTTRITTGTAFKQLGTILNDADTGTEAIARLRQYVNNPDALTDMFGNVPISIEAEAARPVIKEALAELEKLGAAKSADFNPLQFLADATPHLETAAQKLAGFDPTKMSSAQKAFQSMKSWMSEFYLRTPGYVIRNWISDNTVKAMDGLKFYENYGNVLSDLEKFGTTTQRVATGTGGLIDDIGGATSKLEKIPVVGAIQTKIGEIADSQEKKRYVQAFHSALMDSWGANWKPQLSEDTYTRLVDAGLGDIADDIEAAWQGARSGKEARTKLLEVLNAKHPAEKFYVSRYLNRATDLPTELQAKIESKARDIAKAGGAPEEVATYIDDLIREASDDTAGKMVDVGPVLTPRKNTEGAWVQEVEELQRDLGQELARAVDSGQMQPSEAEAVLLEEVTKWRDQTRQLHQARQTLRDAFANVPQDAKADDVLAAINHAITQEMEGRERVRLQLDAYRRDIMRQDRFSRADWDGYRKVRNELWDEQIQQAVGEYGRTQQALDAIAQGNPNALSSFNIQSLDDRAEQMLQRARERMSAGQQEAFDKMVNTARYNFDQAQFESLRQVRTLLASDSSRAQDSFDVLLSAYQDADAAFQQAVGAQFRALRAKDAGKINLAQYDKIVSEAWETAWGRATKRYSDYVPAQLRGLGLTEDQAQAIGAGVKVVKPGDEAAGLAPEVTSIWNSTTPPPTADEFLAGRTPADALTEARTYLTQAEEAANAPATGAALREAREGMGAIEPKDVQQFLKPTGEPKTYNGKAWTEELPNVVDRRMIELGYDNPEEFLAALQEAQRTGRAIRRGSGTAKDARAAAAAREKWAAIVDDLEGRQADDALQRSRQAYDQAKAAGASDEDAALIAQDVFDATPDQLAQMDQLAVKHGDAQPPDLRAVLTANERHTIDALQKVKAGLTEQWGKTIPTTAIPGDIRKLVEGDMGRIVQELNETRAAAISAAQARADFSLLDYGMKRGFDAGLAAFAPYYYWGSRQARNFAHRIADKPAILANYYKYREGMEKQNRDRGYRKRFEGGWEIGDGSRGGATLFVDPLMWIFPFAGLAQTDMIDPRDSKSTAAALYEAANSLGMRAAPYIDLPLRYLNLLVDAEPGTPEYEEQVAQYGRGSMGNVVPQTGLIRGLTSLAGIGGPGGIDIERPLRTALGGEEAGKWEGYTVARSVRDMAAEANMASLEAGQQFNNAPFLLAQAVISQKQTNDWGAILNTTTAQQLAEEMKVPLSDAAAAIQIIREAADRAGKQRGVQSVASTLLGTTAKVLPEGERSFVEMQQAERGAGYSPQTGYGSKKDVDYIRKLFPALAVGRAQYGTLPGESETMPLQLYQRSQLDELNAQFDALKDEQIRRAPWDKQAAAQIEEMRQQAISRVKGDQQTTTDPNDWRGVFNQAAGGAGIPTGQAPEPYRPRSIAGATPAEAVEIRKEEVMSALTRTMPKPDQFTDPTTGAINWDAYNQATQQWQTSIPTLTKTDPTVAAVVAKAGEDGYGAQVAAFAQRVSANQVDAYRRRNDSPLEAVQRAYYELVYQPTWGDYRARKGELDAAETAYANAIQAGDNRAAAAAAAQYRQIKDATKTAFQDTVGAAGPLNAQQLMALVEKRYPGQFSPKQLSDAFGQMEMPGVQEVQRLGMTPEERAEAEKRDREMRKDQIYDYERQQRAAAAAAKKAQAQATAIQQYAGFEQMMKEHYGEQAYGAFVEYQFADNLTKKQIANGLGTVDGTKRGTRTIDQMMAVRHNYLRAHPELKKQWNKLFDDPTAAPDDDDSDPDTPY